MVKSKLSLSKTKIAEARKLSKDIIKPVQKFVDAHTTVSVERASLRLLGADGADSDGVPTANIITQQCGDNLKNGASRYYLNALVKLSLTPADLNKRILDSLNITEMEFTDKKHIDKKANELLAELNEKITYNTKHRNKKLKQYKDKSPLLYVIVATGNIYEDVAQAQAAGYQGADIVAVIRTTAQSLLDYVPYGATTEGFGGTYATQENFKIMRKALDETVEKEKRYIRLVNYASGLCMPEIAAMGAVERLDMMLNDSMYGILFRDINMYRTFTDQNFSRMINAVSDITINTGEDNYLTTSDAIEKAHTVLTSQLINEQFAFNAGMPVKLMGLGHAFEMDPNTKNGFLYEYAQALMAREIFPNHPLKYMPPTKFMTGDVFKGYAMNTMFNFITKATKQSIALLGMLTEAIHTPFLQDRALALENAKYVHNNIDGLYDELEFKKDGIIVNRAKKVLNDAIDMLAKIKKVGLFDAIEKGMFAEVKRPKNGGKGLDGVHKKSSDYYNPVEDYLKKKLGIKK